MKNIVCFGDSNTHGFRASDGGRFLKSQRWTGILSERIGDRFHIIEEGLNGRTTTFEDPVQECRAGVNYITPCLLSHKPISLLIIMLGTNDTKERFGASSAVIALGLKRLVQKAMSTECWVNGKPNILIVVPKNIEKEYEKTFALAVMGKGCAEKSQGLREEYKNIADLLGCHWMDANEFVTANDPIDCIHLTEQGHREFAIAMENKIREILGSDPDH
ncbi:MAG: GDSL-type esterase/lipase family protein [Peptostreptococcaceae bacterium]|nr:GDSL-type esterase/lipase family protein [Peptostreptococcaceae bacterium]